MRDQLIAEILRPLFKLPMCRSFAVPGDETADGGL